MPGVTRYIPKGTEAYSKLLRKLQSRIEMARKANSQQQVKWDAAEERMLAFLPETEEDSLRNTRRTAGKPQYTTIQIPYTYAIIMALHTYITSVFLGRDPVHQFQGRHGEGEMQVQSMEALISYQVEVGRMLGPYYVWLHDMCKYGVGILGEYWDIREVQFSTVTEQVDPANPTAPPKKIQETVRVKGYTGNTVYNISPYDFLPDPRVPVWRYQEGEFCAVRRIVSWNELLRRKKNSYYNELVDDLRQSSSALSNTLGSAQLKRPQQWMLSDSDGEKHPATVELYEVYVELVQTEWELGPSDFPEKWVFTVDSTMENIIGIQPLGVAHGQFPFAVGQMEIEGYGLYARGMPEIIKPLQETMDWLINSHFYNVRASMNNQFVFDPSKIYVKDVQKGGPGFAFRLRPSAYGQKIEDFFKQIPVTDTTRAHMGDIQQVIGLGERIHGVNEQILGVLSGSGRKTATEVRTSTGFGVNRLKTISEWISATTFSPHSTRLVQNSQQFYDLSLKLKIVGDLAQDAGPRFMQIGPDDILGMFDFVPVDGTMPVDRFAQATMWKEIMTDMVQLPQVMMGYDFTKIFAYVAQLAGLKNIKQFRVQITPDQQLAAAAQAGNVIPMKGKTGGRTAPPTPDASSIAGMNALGG